MEINDHPQSVQQLSKIVQQADTNFAATGRGARQEEKSGVRTALTPLTFIFLNLSNTTNPYGIFRREQRLGEI